MKHVIVTAIVLAMLVGACYPGGPEYYEETDIVFTEYEPDYDFASKMSYAMPDSIVKVTGDLIEGKDPEFVKEPYNTQIINRIASNMSDLGWSRVESPDEADLTLMPAAWTNTTIYYWYDYWCWYYPWYCGWGWGYPYYTSFTTGTMVMGLVANDQDLIEPEAVWTAAINGLLSGSYNTQRMSKSIDQAFEQSPYLNIK